MDQAVFRALGQELCKEAGLARLWEKFTDVFRGEKSKAERRAGMILSPDTTPAVKWKNLPRNVGSPAFVKAVQSHPNADSELKQHVQSMHELTRGKTLGKVESAGGGGKKYEIRRMSGGKAGCTCNDWRYKGSVNPGYECKHIRAFNEGKTKVSSFQDQTGAFFDELEAIQHSKAKAREKDKKKRNDGVYSNMLLQDETPEDYPSTAPDPEHPDLIIGSR